MTLPEIRAAAEAKWGIVKGDCPLTKAAKRQAKKAMIEKLMKLYNVKESVN